MKAVGAFNADFVQVILLVNTRYLVLMDLPSRNYSVVSYDILHLFFSKTIFFFTSQLLILKN